MTQPNDIQAREQARLRRARPCARLHLCFGWWSLLIFSTLGGVLEAMHGFKIGWYLDVGNETRRLLWTLAHAHGSILSLVNIAFGYTVTLLRWHQRWRAIASRCLLLASVLIPGGFLLGGTIVYSGDPGLGILLLPAGAILLAVAVCATAVAAQTSGWIEDD